MAQAKAKPALRTFIFQGTVELHGVQFYVTAEDEDGAREKAKAGDYVDYDTRTAETVNWDINPETLESND